ncbi:MAG: hypothetical protein QM767_19535 [Anaeromyxobacter sp.]
MRGFRNMILLALLAPAAALASEAPPAPSAMPSPEELAPLLIPELPARQTTLAGDLDRACQVLSGEAARARLASRGSQRILASAEASLTYAGLRHACDAVLGVAPAFTEEDMAALEAFQRAPSLYREALQKEFQDQGGEPQGPTALATSLGGLAANVVNGLADFLYDRAKLEAATYLRQQLTAELCQEARRPFLPATCAAFESADLTISLGAIGSYLVSAARRDLRQLPDTALVYGLHALPPEQRAGRDLLFGGRLGLAYYWAVAGGRTPLDVGRSLHALRPAHVPAPELLEALVLTSQLVDAITQQAGWEKLEPTRFPTLARCHVAAVLLTVRGMPADEGRPLDLSTAERFSKASRQAGAVLDLVADLAALKGEADRLADALRERTRPAAAADFSSMEDVAKAPVGGTATGRDYAVLATRFLGVVVRDGTALAGRLGPAAPDEPRLQALPHVAGFGEQLVTAVDAQQYDPSAMAVAAVSLLEGLDAELARAHLPRVLKLPEPVRQAVPFIAQLAQAKSADEARAVIEAAAVPAGAYRDRYRKPVVALGSFVGVSGGAEAVKLHGTEWSGVAGPFAPVGLTATWPRCGGACHLGVMVSVLNVGALVSTRFQADTSTSGGETKTVGNDTTVEWANVLTPGVFGTVGIGRSPFTLGAGLQVLPARQVEITDGSGTRSSTTPAVQGLVFLGVDVPIFAF